jgi:hypothetical protein
LGGERFTIMKREQGGMGILSMIAQRRGALPAWKKQ